ncbi:MAG: hypothetical protein K6F99_06195 [Lachnospiraceae bacterium]|nr:hypothetical protein [Lachnospiraceae bacterium]
MLKRNLIKDKNLKKILIKALSIFTAAFLAMAPVCAFASQPPSMQEGGPGGGGQGGPGGGQGGPGGGAAPDGAPGGGPGGDVSGNSAGGPGGGQGGPVKADREVRAVHQVAVPEAEVKPFHRGKR